MRPTDRIGGDTEQAVARIEILRQLRDGPGNRRPAAPDFAPTAWNDRFGSNAAQALIILGCRGFRLAGVVQTGRGPGPAGVAWAVPYLISGRPWRSGAQLMVC
jgi:hypothetical protein